MTKPNSFIMRLQDEIFEFAFADRTYKVNPAEDFPIDEENLSEEFANQSSLYAYLAILNAKSHARVRKAELALERTEARAYERIRTSMKLDGDKTTETAIKNKVKLDPQVMQAQDDLIEAEAANDTLKAMENFGKMRADMLIRLGSMYRAELSQTDMHVNKSSPADRMRENLAKRRSNHAETERESEEFS